MKTLKFSFMLSLLVFNMTACGHKSFTSPVADSIESTDDTSTPKDPISKTDVFTMQEVSSGGGIAVAEDETFYAETLIGAVVFQENESSSGILMQTGIWSVLSEVL